MQRDELGLK